MKCPCGSQKPYEECCGQYHQGETPPDAHALMRSRYSAYALGKIDYIIETTHPEHPDTRIPLSTRQKHIHTFCKNTHFEKLDILSFEPGESTSYVTFHAQLSQKGQDVSFTERSRFEKHDGRWLYHSMA